MDRNCWSKATKTSQNNVWEEKAETDVELIMSELINKSLGLDWLLLFAEPPSWNLHNEKKISRTI